MPVMTETKLKQIRKALGYKQEDFAIDAGLRISTYRNAEQTGRTSYVTAKSILVTINNCRKDRGQLPIAIEDLGLMIR